MSNQLTKEVVAVDDDAVAEKARERILASPYASIRKLSCTCVDGELTLHGWLPSFYQNQVAQESVAGLVGVSRVINEIEVSNES